MNIIIAFLLLVLVHFPVLAQPAQSSPWPRQMSAEQVMLLPNGQSMSSKIFIDHDKVRVEADATGFKMVSIVRMDKKLVYLVMPEMKMVTQQPLVMDNEVAVNVFNPELQYSPLGDEMLDGVLCEKFKINMDSTQSQTFWINKTSKTPVKMATDDGKLSVVWKNVVLGPQPAALFDPPAGYNFVDSQVMQR